MNKAEQKQELAMIAVILGDHFCEKLYTKMQEKGMGYISTAEQIAEWAFEFEKTHRKTDWEIILEDGIKPLSKSISSIICWDDAIYDFGYFKLEKF